MLFVVVAVAVAVVVVVVAEGGKRFPHSIYTNSRSTALAAVMLLILVSILVLIFTSFLHWFISFLRTP